jgi:hypothetical protein
MGTKGIKENSDGSRGNSQEREGTEIRDIR